MSEPLQNGFMVDQKFNLTETELRKTHLRLLQVENEIEKKKKKINEMNSQLNPLMIEWQHLKYRMKRHKELNLKK